MADDLASTFFRRVVVASRSTERTHVSSCLACHFVRQLQCPILFSRRGGCRPRNVKHPCSVRQKKRSRTRLTSLSRSEQKRSPLEFAVSFHHPVGNRSFPSTSRHSNSRRVSSRYINSTGAMPRMRRRIAGGIATLRFSCPRIENRERETPYLEGRNWN